jgi:hypothetical protein
MSSTSEQSSDVDEPATNRPRFFCPRGCAIRLYSRTTYYRHIRQGCQVEQATYQWQHLQQGIPADAGIPQEQTCAHDAELPPQSPSPGISCHSHPQQSQSPYHEHNSQPEFTQSASPDIEPTDGAIAPSVGPMSEKELGSEDDCEEEKELSEYDELYMPVSQQVFDSESEEDHPQSALYAQGGEEGQGDGEHVDSEEGGSGEEGDMEEQGRRAYGTSDGCKRRTAQWYIDRKGQPLFPGCKLTLFQTCFALLHAKLDHRLTDQYVEEHCQYQSTVVLPDGNLHPPTLHLLKKICGVEDLKKCEKHVCVNDCVRFKDLPQSQWDKDEKCPVCKELRFMPGKTHGKLLIPKKVFYELPPEDAMRRNFGDPEFCQRRGTHRHDQALDFYKSAEARRLDLATGGALSNKDNSAWEIGYDHMQPFTFTQYSVGLIGMRCDMRTFVQYLPALA